MGSVGLLSRTDLLKRRAWIDYAAAAWYTIAAAVSTIAGFRADSIALSAFGFESLIQIAMVVLVLRRLHLQSDGQMGKDEERVERMILFILGVTFFLLALYILHESGSKLFYKEKPQTSVAGIVLSALAFAACIVLALFKLRTAQALESRTLRADAGEDAARVYLAFILFFGLWLPGGRGFWWADPIAALLMLPFIVREGWKAIEASKGSSFKSRTKKTI